MKGSSLPQSHAGSPTPAVASSFPTREGQWRAYAQLVRLPNVFTALADIWLGAFAVQATSADAGSRWPAYLLLMITSACLYCAGMVWNDFCDLEQDRRERPFRPLPSGRVSLRTARNLGIALLVLGWSTAFVSGLGGDALNWTPAAVAGCLVIAILLYDAWLKRTWAGPIAMGTCRLLNVLLGFSSVAGGIKLGLFPAVIVGIYIIGVTWFARTEARFSRKASLAGAAAAMLWSLCLAVPLPVVADAGVTAPLFPYLLVALGFFVGVPICQAINVPAPSRVQTAVKRSILGLVVLDAVLATALAGTMGVVILILLLPAMYLGRWIYST